LFLPSLTLFMVVGRKAGTIPGYAYSEAMSGSGLRWSAAELRRYLAAPGAVVPGGKMKFRDRLADQELEDLVAFLLAPA
jgi:cytochrome c